MNNESTNRTMQIPPLLKTENERHHLREHFLEPETRCGFFVDEKRKRLWKRLLDLLELVASVCNENKLRWTMSGGSLLGTVRHGGFIPWDDDVDIMLPRPDYERLLEILPGKLPPHLHMQTAETDPGFVAALMKVRDSRTSCIFPQYAVNHFPMNMGVFLDVLPIDPDPDNPKARQRLEHRSRRIRGIRMFNFLKVMLPECSPVAAAWKAGIKPNSWKETKWAYRFVRQPAAKFFWTLFGSKRLYEMRERPFREMAKTPHPNWSIYPAQVGYIARGHLAAEWLDEYIDAPFEYLTVKIMKHYDEALSQNYGDWKTPRQDPSDHEGMIANPDVPYKETLMREYGWTQQEVDGLP